ncbi:MAG TPA: diadenylate cyclase CdaA [Thermodesulfobacteriota bacterium]|nr:diadenylate cyclase CdaA [Thermodesulfobacteriota bacterium]
MNDLLHLFRWQDALDILILTYIFYRLYLWLRKKKALRMILAILALPLFYIFARWIDLPLSVWGLQNLWPVILIVLVVIFQEEIREVLGNVSLPSFFFGRSEKLTSEAIDRIVEAAFQMAERRIGGLIVFQKGDDLDELIHEKTDVDAEINEDLLISIFSPQSPLHDGAVVVQGDRIRHAAALLPLCKSTSLPKEWGTRHRAGVGITEVSDAECMIISEERGEVLLACKGALQKKARREDLRQALVDVAPVQEKKNGEKKWPKKLLKDLPRKALFLFLVCLLWVFVIGLRQGEVGFNIPIEYYSIPQNLVITGEPPKELNVRLKGSQRLLLSLKPDQVRVRIDLSSARKGSNQISLSETNIDVSPGISVSNFYPRNIRLQLSSVFPADRIQ